MTPSDDTFLSLEMRRLNPKPAVFVSQNETVACAARAMRAAQAAACLVGSAERLEGIVTERDVVRAVAEGRDTSEPVAALMTPEVVTIGADEPVSEALIRMSRLGIRRLAVLDGQGLCVALADEHDLVRAREMSPASLAEQAARARDALALALAQARLQGLVRRLAEEGADVARIGRVVAQVHDLFMARAFDLAGGCADPRSCRRAEGTLLVLGSEGRREQYLATDQDNAFIVADHAPGQVRAGQGAVAAHNGEPRQTGGGVNHAALAADAPAARADAPPANAPAAGRDTAQADAAAASRDVPLASAAGVRTAVRAVVRADAPAAGGDASQEHAPPASQAQATALAQAGRMQELVAAAGLPPCPHKVMADNPAWCMTLEAWRSRLDAMVRNPDAAAVLELSLLADLRPVCGDAAPAAALLDHLRHGLGKNPVVLRYMAREACRFEPPLGLMGAITVVRAGADKGGFDIKRGGVFPLTQGAKVLALELGLAATSTQARLEGACELGVFGPRTLTELKDAFAFLQELRLRAQLERLRQGGEPGNMVFPEGLSRSATARLRECLRAVSRFQELLAAKYALHLLT